MTLGDKGAEDKEDLLAASLEKAVVRFATTLD